MQQYLSSRTEEIRQANHIVLLCGSGVSEHVWLGQPYERDVLVCARLVRVS